MDKNKILESICSILDTAEDLRVACVFGRCMSSGIILQATHYRIYTIYIIN